MSPFQADGLGYDFGPLMEEGCETFGAWLASTFQTFPDTWILTWARGQVGFLGAGSTTRACPQTASWPGQRSTLSGQAEQWPGSWDQWLIPRLAWKEVRNVL